MVGSHSVPICPMHRAVATPVAVRRACSPAALLHHIAQTKLARPAREDRLRSLRTGTLQYEADKLPSQRAHAKLLFSASSSSSAFATLLRSRAAAAGDGARGRLRL